MLGNFYLRLTENLLEMADAERRLCQQMQYAKARLVTKALINPDKVGGH